MKNVFPALQMYTVLHDPCLNAYIGDGVGRKRSKMPKEVWRMGRRRRGVMSEQLKYELAKDLGFYDTVQREGWGGITTKDAGNMVKRAIQLAEQNAAQRR